jgi:nitrogen fixation protein NifZ
MFNHSEPNPTEESSRHSRQHPELQRGDAVIAKIRIINDGSVPDADMGEVFAETGTMGMLVNIGYFEDKPTEELFLICFQMANGELGPPVTCLAHEIAPAPAVQH